MLASMHTKCLLSSHTFDAILDASVPACLHLIGFMYSILSQAIRNDNTLLHIYPVLDDILKR